MATTTPTESSTAAGLAHFHGKAAKLWSDDAPKAVRRGCLAGENGPGWDAWSEHLRKRRRPSGLGKLLGAKSSPLEWSLPEDLAAALELVAPLTEATRSRGAAETAVELLRPWLAEAAGRPANRALGLECLAVAHALPHMASSCATELWWETLDQLVDAALHAQTDLHADPLATQWLTGELPLTLAWLFSELTACRKLHKPASRNLSQGLLELLDGEGLPHCRNLSLLRPLLACWTRSVAIGKAMKQSVLSEDAASQYEWLVRNSLRLTRHDGSQAFSHDSAGAWNAELFDAALDLGGDEEDAVAASAALPGRQGKKKKSSARLDRGLCPEPANDSEWSEFAVLRTDWSRRAERVFIEYDRAATPLEIDLGKQIAIAGEWTFDLQINGEPAKIESEWQQVCWMSDDDVDYLELEAELTGAARIQRQILLARDERFLLLCDNVLTDSAEKITYRGHLPLADGVAYEPAGESREGLLVAGKPVARVLPLALAEWRADPRGGELQSAGRALELALTGHGANLCCPLFFDLKPTRLKKPFTWRRLTVAEHLEIQPPSTAVGYRVQCGRDQWLFYRSLSQVANRSLLGENVSGEFLAARFTRDGETEELIQIE
jgi:hypothetical protein